MRPIKLIDLSLKEDLRSEILKDVANVIDSKNYVLGKNLEVLEKNFSKFCQARWAVGVGNGTDALRLCLRALGVGRGDKVLTVAFTSPFTALAILEEGATPVFCDIDDETLTLDVKDVEKKVDKKTKAIICVHIYGNPCNMQKIQKIAKLHKLKIIEDACQAHGAKYHGKHVGNFSDAAAFSFYPTKNLGAMGDAGMVVTNSASVARKIKLLRHGGQTRRFWHEFIGINSRLDEIQAAILNIKLKNLENQNKKRRACAQFYQSKLSDMPIRFQKLQANSVSSYHIFTIRTKLRDKLKKYLASSGIEGDIYYPYPVHLQPLFAKYAKRLPVTEKVCREILAVPVHQNLTLKDKDLIVKSIRSFFLK